MLISRSWLEQFVDLSSYSSAEIAEMLTMRVAEVEEIFSMKETLHKIVVGNISSIEPHPNADKLKVCHVSVGKKKVQVICGGSNIVEGQKVALGMLGAKVRWHGEGELITLVEATIRGERSFGMICAADEIGLGEMFPKTVDSEILDLSHLEAKEGTPLAKALGLDGEVFDIDNKTLTHRPDLWGHYGMARELGALFNKKVKVYEAALPRAGKGEDIAVEVKDSAGCPRYMAVALSGVTVGPSPAWLRHAVTSVGMNSINNIVDTTNYVMLELGQPLHAFDISHIEKKKIIVRKAKKEESFISLDGTSYILDPSDLVIADSKKVLALAGIKGSKESGVTEETQTIVIESANFDAARVRQSSTRHGLRTDSSMRFEKSLDPEQCALALATCTKIIQELCPNAKVVSKVIDVQEKRKKMAPIHLSLEDIEGLIGQHIPKQEVIGILRRLGFDLKEKKKGEYAITVPSYRATKDIQIKEDIIEEIIRVYGYDRIEATCPDMSVFPPAQEPLRALTRKVQMLLAYEGGYDEVYNYSFVSPEMITRSGEDPSAYIALDNPIAKDRPFVRRSLVTNMLEVLEKNGHRYDHVQPFEIGKVFRKEEEGVLAAPKGKEHLPKQDTYLCMALMKRGEEVPFQTLATDVAALMDRLGYALRYVSKEGTHALVHPTRFAEVVVGETPIGYIAEIHPAKVKKLGLPARAAIVEINISQLANIPAAKPEETYAATPLYPHVQRDIALLLKRSAQHDDIARALIEADVLTTDVELFDVYMGKGIDEDKKSMAYRITYQAPDRTLSTKEVDAVHEKILTMLKNTFGASIR